MRGYCLGKETNLEIMSIKEKKTVRSFRIGKKNEKKKERNACIYKVKTRICYYSGTNLYALVLIGLGIIKP
jgi:hypothetical protein